MYKREFDQLLASGAIPKSLMLYGDNDYYIDTAAEAFIDRSGAREGMLKLYFDEYDFQTAKNYLGQSSLFGDLNLLVVRSDRKIPKKELVHLIDLAHRNANNFFLYIYTGSDFRTMTSAFSKKAHAEHVRFFPPNPKEAADIVLDKARRMGVEIDRYAVEHLLMALNFNLSMAVNELNRLAILEGPIGAKEIDEHLFSLAPMAMDTFLSALFSRKPLTEILPRMQQLGEDEFAILRAIQYFVDQLFMFHLYIKLHGAPDSAAILGYRLPRQLEQRRAQLAVKIPLPLFERIFDTLAEGELAIKTAGGSSQKETLLLSILIKIKSFLG
ncbi:DNA polymerase III subunit delta [Hydrogenimonas sp.]